MVRPGPAANGQKRLDMRMVLLEDFQLAQVAFLAEIIRKAVTGGAFVAPGLVVVGKFIAAEDGAAGVMLEEGVLDVRNEIGRGFGNRAAFAVVLALDVVMG
jgi:hypothetical protein